MSWDDEDADEDFSAAAGKAPEGAVSKWAGEGALFLDNVPLQCAIFCSLWVLVSVVRRML